MLESPKEKKNTRKQSMDHDIFPSLKDNSSNDYNDIQRDIYRSIAENTSDLICITEFSINPVYTYVNPSYKRILGYEKEEMIGKNGFDFIHPEDKRTLYPIIKKYLKHKINQHLSGNDEIIMERIDCRLKDKQGNYHSFEFTANLIGNKLLFIGKDKTESKRIEKALEKRLIALTKPLDEQIDISFENLFDLENIQQLQDEFALATGVASIITKTDGTPITKPSNFCRLCSDIIRKTEEGRKNCYKSDAALGRKNTEGPIIQHCMSGGLWDAGASISVGGTHIANWLIGQVRDATQTEENMRTYARTIGADENEMVNAFYEVPTMSREQFGRVAQALFTFANQLSNIAYQNIQQARFITERKKNEQKLQTAYDQLKESEGKLNTLFESMTEMVVLHELVFDTQNNPNNYRILDTNNAFTKITGIQKEDAIGQLATDLYESDHPPFFEEFSKVALTGESYHFETYYESMEKHFLISVVSTGYHKFATVTTDITERKKIEQDLKESEEKYRTYIKSAPYGIFICDEQGHYLDINEEATKITGYSTEELLHMSIAEITAEEGLELAQHHFNTLRETGESYGINQFRHKDGSIHWWVVNAIKLSDTRYLGFTKDITAQKKMEMAIKLSESKLKSIFENKGTAVGIFGDDGIITLCNTKLEELTGYTQEEIIGKMKWSDFVTPDDLRKMKQYHKDRSVGKSPPKEYECCIYDKSGKIKSLIVNIGVIPETRERIVSLTDITRQKEAEKQLKILNEDLEEKVKERTKKIQHLLRQKDEFINQLGHDLKNPLGPFMQLLPILQNYIHDEKGKQMVNVLQRNAHYMRNLVKKNIDLAKLNSPNTQFNFNRESLHDLVEDVIMINQTLFDDHIISVENHIKSDCIAYVDHLHIQEIFTNLFNNAVKYMGGSGTITIDAECQSDEVIVSITDTGIGISADQIEYLFDEYYKADESRHDFDSSGLGLSICKSIIEKHGGRIWVESEGIGKGSTFYFSLPIHA